MDRKIRLFTWGLLFWSAALLIGTLYAISFRCHNKDSPILTWRDADTGIRFLVLERDAPIAGKVSTFVVQESVQIDDHMEWGVARFVRFEDWLLVLNEQYVVSGYNYKTRQVLGEAKVRQLPFTIRKSAGTVVAEKQCGIHPTKPQNFPSLIEGSSTSPVP